MLIARVHVTATDEGRDTLLTTLEGEAQKVPAAFDGCQRFHVSVDTADPNNVLIIEEWSDRAAFERYTSSSHFADIMSVAGPCLAAPPDSAYYEGHLVGP